MVAFACGRAFNVYAAAFPSWSVPATPQLMYRLGVGQYDLPQDVFDDAYVQAHSRDQLVAAGEVIVQHDPSVYVLQDTNRRHAHSLQATTTILTGPPTYLHDGPLARYPSFIRGVLEPAPLDTAGAVDTDVTWNMPTYTDAGLPLPMIELPTGAKWKDSTWTISGRTFWFAPDAPPTAYGVERAVPIQSMPINLWARTEEPPAGMVGVVGKDGVRRWAKIAPDPLSHVRIRPGWIDDPSHAERQRAQAEAMRALQDEDGQPVLPPRPADPVYRERPPPRPQMHWSQWHRLAQPHGIPPEDPVFLLTQRAQANYAARYIQQWHVPEAPAWRHGGAISYGHEFVGPATPAHPPATPPAPIYGQPTPTPPPMQIQRAAVRDVAAEDRAAALWRWSRMPGRERRRIGSLAAWMKQAA